MIAACEQAGVNLVGTWSATTQYARQALVERGEVGTWRSYG